MLAGLPMDPRRSLKVVPRVLALWAIMSGGVQGQGAPTARGGVIHGTVYDSIAGAPLAGAAVFLWNTSHRAVSDSEGRFRIAGVPPGTYSIVFYHERLGSLGISPGPTSVTLAESDTLDVALATPSMLTVASAQCLAEEPVPGTGTYSVPDLP